MSRIFSSTVEYNQLNVLSIYTQLLPPPKTSYQRVSIVRSFGRIFDYLLQSFEYSKHVVSFKINYTFVPRNAIYDQMSRHRSMGD